MYMVRAVKLSTTPSGSYFNASTGQIVEAPASLVATSQDNAGLSPALSFRPSSPIALAASDAQKLEPLSAVVDELAGL
jgi:hypothetical protein